MNYQSRLDQIRRTVRRKCDAIVVSDLTNVRYLTSYNGTSGLVVATRDKAWFITDFRYKSQAAQQVPDIYEIVIAKRGLWREAARLLNMELVSKVGFESEHTTVAVFDEVRGWLKGAELVSMMRAVEGLRLHKDRDEIGILRQAIAITDDCFDYICGVLRPGLTEKEVAARLRRAMEERGATGPSFTTIVASGVRGALPHGVASEKKLAAGEMVTIDMGCIYNGYCSDMTRTVCLGKPTREQQKIYETVWIAQTTAAAALRPGLGCKAADKIAREIIDKAGYKENFGHGLGHGVGLNIHEPPRLSQIGKGKLAPGMVVSCEPGIYIPDWGGVRIEDLLVITETGAETLTKCSKPRKIIAV